MLATLPIPPAYRTTARTTPTAMIATNALSHQVSRIRQFMWWPSDSCRRERRCTIQVSAANTP